MSLRIMQVDTFGVRDDARTLGGERLMIGEGMQIVRRIEPLPLGRAARYRTVVSLLQIHGRLKRSATSVRAPRS